SWGVVGKIGSYLPDAALTPYPAYVQHVTPRPDKTRQASHPALPPGVFFLNPITNPALPFSLFSGDG
ncbi:hypothetical protein MMS73_08930, partial [Escherichia coli]|nr:hypothetical protein [Escherichia coli]